LGWLIPLALLGALPVGGCSYQLDSLLTKSDADMEQTGSIGRAGDQAKRAVNILQPSDADLAYARAVAADLLARNRKDDSLPWENPNTGARGSITPLAASYSEGAFTCRDFLASYVRGEAETWLQGEACRTEHGKWEVKSLTPLSRG